MPRDDTQVREFEMPVVVPDSELVKAMNHIRARLSDPKRWARGTSFKTIEGAPTNDLSRVYSACLGGTMAMLRYEKFMPMITTFVLRAANEKVNRFGRVDCFGSIPDFNDHAWTTHEVMLDTLDRATEYARLSGK